MAVSKFPWFPHDCGARNSRKIKVLRTSFGSEGYGWYYMLLEILREENGYELDLNDSVTRKFVLREIDAPDERFGDFIDTCVDLRLFDYENGILWSRGLKTRMVQYEAKCAILRKNASKGGKQKVANAKLLLSKSVSKSLPTHSRSE